MNQNSAELDGYNKEQGNKERQEFECCPYMD